MISALRLKNFKNFKDETLTVGPLTVIAGANASGKSNVRDALRFLHGVGRGYSLADILGGKYGPGGQAEWLGVRGSISEFVHFGGRSFQLEAFFDQLILQLWDKGKLVTLAPASYDIEVEIDVAEAANVRVTRERLRKDQADVFTSHPEGDDPVSKQDDDNHLLIRMSKTGSQKKYGHRIGVRPQQPALTQINEHPRIVSQHKTASQKVIDQFEDMRFLDLSPERMRNPSFPGQTVLGDRGENLPTVLKAIWEDVKLQDTLRDWLRELTPMDVVDFEFPSDTTSGRVQLVIIEADGQRVSGYSASDGTLRFLAMLAALLGPNRPALYVFEEIDNGIHPSRLHLLVELIEQQTASGDMQVITTTHSPQLLTMLSDETFKYASVVCRPDDSNDAVIRAIHQLPNADELRQSQGLDRLHVSGWFEDAISFAGSSAEKP